MLLKDLFIYGLGAGLLFVVYAIYCWAGYYSAIRESGYVYLITGSCGLLGGLIWAVLVKYIGENPKRIMMIGFSLDAIIALAFVCVPFLMGKIEPSPKIFWGVFLIIGGLFLLK